MKGCRKTGHFCKLFYNVSSNFPASHLPNQLKPFLMKRLPITSLITLLLLTFTADCRTDNQPFADIRKDFVHFDQAFLPVLSYVSENNIYEAKRAVFHLGYHWQQLKNRHEMAVAQPDWQHAFRRVDKHLNAAFFAIDANQKEQALLQLERIKQELIDLRSSYKIDYYLDYLYDFQATATVLQSTVEDEMLTLLEWEDVMAMAVEMNRKWNVVIAKRFDAALYEFDETQQWKFNTTLESATNALNKVNVAMDCAERLEVAKASKKLELAFAEVIRLFGDFESATTYYAQAQQ